MYVTMVYDGKTGDWTTILLIKCQFHNAQSYAMKGDCIKKIPQESSHSKCMKGSQPFFTSTRGRSRFRVMWCQPGRKREVAFSYITPQWASDWGPIQLWSGLGMVWVGGGRTDHFWIGFAPSHQPLLLMTELKPRARPS